MEHQFWIDKWNEGQIGFHQSEINANLKNYFPKLSRHSKVLVPLCGKTKDMLWLKDQGYSVTGIELHREALESFFSENGIPREDHDNHYSTQDITLFWGDYFQFKEGPFDAVYDRAALVALPPQMRKDYAAHTLSLLKPKAELLVIAFEYDQDKKAGPPFSVPEEEVRTIYKGAEVELLNQSSQKPKNPNFIEAGIETFKTKVYRITKN